MAFPKLKFPMFRLRIYDRDQHVASVECNGMDPKLACAGVGALPGFVEAAKLTVHIDLGKIAK